MMQKTSTAAAPVLAISKMNGFENKAGANAEAQAASPVNTFQSVLKTQQKTQANQPPKAVEQRQQAPAKPLSKHEDSGNTASKSADAAKNPNATQVKAEATAGQPSQAIDSTNTVEEMVALAKKALPVDATANQEEKHSNGEAVDSGQPVETALFGLTPAVIKSTTSQATQAEVSTKAAANESSVNDLDSKILSIPPERHNDHANKADGVSASNEHDAFYTQLKDAKSLQANAQSAAMNAPLNQEVENPVQLLPAMSGLQKPLAAVAIESPQAAQQVISSHIAEPFSAKTGWNQAISQRVLWMVGAGEQSATLTLNPPDLGPLQVVVQVHNGMADTRFTSDNAEVRQALQDGMDNLREKMRESGVQLGQTNVQSGEQSRQEFQQTSQQNNVDARKHANTDVAQNSPVINQVKSYVATGLVDTFA